MHSAFLMICSAILIQSIACQYPGVPNANQYGYGYGAPYGCGGGPVRYGGAGVGDVAVVGEVPVVGSTAVGGQVPVQGAVRFYGDVPARGVVSVSGGCTCANSFIY